ncbi:ABC transporter permease [Litoreibacter roseus]|uniref:Peptide ABC transporter permease n=1 Tax=Litoreibacter roseus TaxID=2601869 RepID=A0A6N6JKF6_9RHOB|nr:ABC transporter permease [Litoreibacter roseus]GFE66803.1 peptide ABC transporter permease [Litoreibacter roseus]
MALFILRRIGVMLLTALCLTFIVFFMTTLYPNLEKLAKTQGNFRMSDEAVARYLEREGYLEPQIVGYGQWLGVLPGFRYENPETGEITGRCIDPQTPPEEAARYCGVLQGYWGFSTVFKEEAGEIIGKRLALTGKLAAAAFAVMIPLALIIGIIAGMREGSKADRGLSTFAIATSATPEYVSGVIFIAVFASSAFGLKWFKGSATSAMEDATFANFTLPVMTIALYGVGYIARMTRASMTEVMTAQYIRTARLKGVSFGNIVLKHALRNALIAPFTVIMLQFPYLLTGVVITETLFNYKGFGWTLVQAASNNDIDLLLGCSVVAVFVVLVTQLISDIGYVFLNPRIRIS